MIGLTGTDRWRFVVSTSGFALVLFVPAMVLKEMYLEPMDLPARVALLVGIAISAVCLAVIVIQADDIPWPGDEASVTDRSIE